MRAKLLFVAMLAAAVVAAASPVNAGPGAPVRTPVPSAFPEARDPWRSWGQPKERWHHGGPPRAHVHDHDSGFVVKHRSAPVWVPSQWVWDGTSWVWWPGRWVR